MARLDRPGSSNGFTLVELLVVVVVIGILATIALTSFLHQQRKAWDTAVESDLRSAATAQHTVSAGAGEGEFASSLAMLEAAGFRASPDVNYSGGAFSMTVTAVGGASFCMTARSASGRYFGYSSQFGLAPSSSPLSTTTCD